MTFATLINAVSDALEERVTAAGGTLEIAESLEEAHAFLESAPKKWRLILHWEGYGPHDKSRLGMTHHQIATVIQQAKGLGQRGRTLTNVSPGGAIPFSERLAQVIGWMTAMRFPEGWNADEAGFSLENSQWVTAEPSTRGHVISWKLQAALPAYPLTIPLAFNPES